MFIFSFIISSRPTNFNLYVCISYEVYFLFNKRYFGEKKGKKKNNKTLSLSWHWMNCPQICYLFYIKTSVFYWIIHVKFKILFICTKLVLFIKRYFGIRKNKKEKYIFLKLLQNKLSQKILCILSCNFFPEHKILDLHILIYTFAFYMRPIFCSIKDIFGKTK